MYLLLCTGVSAPLGCSGRGQAGGWTCCAMLQRKARVSIAPDGLLSLPFLLLFCSNSHAHFHVELGLHLWGSKYALRCVCYHSGVGCTACCLCCLLPVALDIRWACVSFYVYVCVSVCARPAVGSWCLPQGLAYPEHVCICLLWPPMYFKLVCARGCGLYPACVALCSQSCLILAFPKPYTISSSLPVPTFSSS